MSLGLYYNRAELARMDRKRGLGRPLPKALRAPAGGPPLTPKAMPKPSKETPVTPLETAANAAGLKDADLLQIAKPSLAPEAAVADLRTRFPDAFANPAPKLYADMDAKERAAWHRKTGIPQPAGGTSMSAATTLPADLPGLHAAARARLMRHPDGVFVQGAGYGPLDQMVHSGKEFGGTQMARAVTGCRLVIEADDTAIARMLRELRPFPNATSGAEMVAARTTQHSLQVRSIAEMTAATGRPRKTQAEHVAEMQARGIAFAVHGHELRVTAPPGALTEGDRVLIREWKPAFLEHFANVTETF